MKGIDKQNCWQPSSRTLVKWLRNGTLAAQPEPIIEILRCLGGHLSWQGQGVDRVMTHWQGQAACHISGRWGSV
eukprot:4501011-Alexandrium_andersonii.AAC.1